MSADGQQVSCLVCERDVRVFSSCLTVSLSSSQAGASTTLLGALEIPRSFRTRCQQAHHPQPADEGQRSHQGGCVDLLEVSVCWGFEGKPPSKCFLWPHPAEAGGERQESSAHHGAATAGAKTPEEASGAAGGGKDPHGQHRVHPVLRQVGLRSR